MENLWFVGSDGLDELCLPAEVEPRMVSYLTSLILFSTSSSPLTEWDSTTAKIQMRVTFVNFGGFWSDEAAAMDRLQRRMRVELTQGQDISTDVDGKMWFEKVPFSYRFVSLREWEAETGTPSRN